MPSPFLVMATQNPIESEGTYPLPEAQVDRFMVKVLVDYPAPADELTVIERALAEPVVVELLVDELAELQAATRRIYVSPAVSRYALSIALATRRSPMLGSEELYVDFEAPAARPDQPRARGSCARAPARPPHVLPRMCASSQGRPSPPDGARLRGARRRRRRRSGVGLRARHDRDAAADPRDVA